MLGFGSICTMPPSPRTLDASSPLDLPAGKGWKPNKCGTWKKCCQNVPSPTLTFVLPIVRSIFSVPTSTFRSQNSQNSRVRAKEAGVRLISLTRLISSANLQGSTFLRLVVRLSISVCLNLVIYLSVFCWFLPQFGCRSELARVDSERRADFLSVLKGFAGNQVGPFLARNGLLIVYGILFAWGLSPSQFRYLSSACILDVLIQAFHHHRIVQCSDPPEATCKISSPGHVPHPLWFIYRISSHTPVMTWQMKCQIDVITVTWIASIWYLDDCWNIMRHYSIHLYEICNFIASTELWSCLLAILCYEKSP